jgi:hypothetical protein
MVTSAQTMNVTTLRLVTSDILVTQETTAGQAFSPLSPVSPLLILTIRARDRVWELPVSLVIVVTVVTDRGGGL